jgi:hypothetical protein
MRSYCWIILGLKLVDAWVAIRSQTELNRRLVHRAWTKRSPSLLLRSLALNDDTNKNNDDTTAAAATDSPMLLYQRILYRFTPMSDVDIPNAIVVEERCRFRPQNDTASGSAVPIGPRTLILRDGQVDDGEIGDELYTLQCGTSHTGAGTDRALETTIATAMFLAGNPDLCHGSLLQVGAGHGLESLLGCVGAALSSRKASTGETDDDDMAEDILTISKKADGLLPPELKSLTISDASFANLEDALRLANAMGVPKSKMNFAELDWRIRHVSSRPNPRGQQHQYLDFSSIIAAGLSFTFPEAKALARTIAHNLQPSAPALTSLDRKPVPRFAIITPERQADCLVDLRHLLERGYKMVTATQYLKVEKIAFHLQKTTHPESTLDDLDLEVSDVREVQFTALTAQHHPEYTGGGSGELFFPMETGAYENQSIGETALWDKGSTPW